MGTKNHPGEFDCYAAADPDEPMFITLGRDGLGATAVRFWAWLYWWRKIFPLEVREACSLSRNGDGLLRDKRWRKYREALQCALSMDAWWLRKRLEAASADRR